MGIAVLGRFGIPRPQLSPAACLRLPRPPHDVGGIVPLRTQESGIDARDYSDVAAPDCIQQGDFGELLAVRQYAETPLTPKCFFFFSPPFDNKTPPVKPEESLTSPLRFPRFNSQAVERTAESSRARRQTNNTRRDRRRTGRSVRAFLRGNRYGWWPWESPPGPWLCLRGPRRTRDRETPRESMLPCSSQGKDRDTSRFPARPWGWSKRCHPPGILGNRKAIHRANTHRDRSRTSR